ncbi:MAG: Uma2 family endonuclease [Cyanobacteria bacterium]|jgi:Uma2 family endonuclease|nr:Uma2 family endonuclease [Cyanobacteria bacterium GSL.Bin21]
MSQLANPILWTIHDLEALPENEELCREIIDGELFVTRTPHWKHQGIIAKLTTALQNWSKQHGNGQVLPSPGIIPSQDNSVIPDLIWISNKRLAEVEDKAGHLTGFPELVIEVLSPGKRNIYRDKQAKLKLYSQGRVQEYWIVDRFNQAVEVYRQDQGKLTLQSSLTKSDNLTSSLLPQFRLAVDEIFV